MKEVFADTGYWVAVTVPSDQHHDRALQVSRILGNVKIVTTEMILAEYLTVLGRPPTREVALRAVDAIRSNPNNVVVPQTALQFKAALELYRRMTDKEWSLTDCASFDTMRSRNIDRALAYDHHFEQSGFVALLR